MAVCLGILWFPRSLRAQSVVPGDGGWKTLRTEHFFIHYPSEKRGFAVRAGKLFEKIHAELAVKLASFTPHTHVTLVFKTDIVNAFANIYGFPNIVLYLDSPLSGDFSRYDLWLENLFVHEYTHILSLNYSSGVIYYLFRYLLGIPPNILAPQGMIEGTAVYEESLGGKGRVNDPLTRMLVRKAVESDSFPGSAEMLTGSQRWPTGRGPYLYGGRFMNFLSSNYGSEGIYKYWQQDDTFPFFLDDRLYRSFGRGYEYFYSEYKKKEYELFENEIQAVKKQGETAFKRLTFDGFPKSFLFVNSEEKPLYFAVPPDRKSGIYKYSNGKATRIRSVNRSYGIAEGGDLKINSEDYYFYPGFGLRYELFDATRNIFLKRLFPGEHAAFPSIDRSGKRLFYITRDSNKRYLVTHSVEDGIISEKPVKLLSVPFTGFLQYTALSPDGKNVVALARFGESGGGMFVICDVSEIDRRQKQGETGRLCRPLIEEKNGGIITQPRFSPDGASLYFSSDADGTYNLYRLNIATRAVHRLTSTTGGFFYPSPSKEKLYAISYFENGYDLVSVDYDKLKNEPVTYFKDGIWPASADDLLSPVVASGEDAKIPEKWQEKNYIGPLAMHPFLTGLLNGILPLNVGLNAYDPLYRHSMTVGVVTGFFDPILYGYYSYSRSGFGFSTMYQGSFLNESRGIICHYDRTEEIGVFCQDQVLESEEGRAYLHYISQGRSVIQQIALGYAHQKLRNAYLSQQAEYDARDLNLSGPEFLYMFDFTKSYSKSVSPEHGARFILDAQYYEKYASVRELSPERREEIEYGVVEGGAAFYLPSLFSYHVNYLSAYGYSSFGPDRFVQKVRLNRFVRGLDYSRSPSNHSAAVFSYEYRFPLLHYFVSQFIGNDLVLRFAGMSLFYDYGASFDRYPQKSDWIGAYGVVFQLGLNIFYLPVEALNITIARGTGEAGELQCYISFSIGFGRGDYTNQSFGRNTKSPVLQNYRKGFPGYREIPGYFRDPLAGGILE